MKRIRLLTYTLLGYLISASCSNSIQHIYHEYIEYDNENIKIDDFEMSYLLDTLSIYHPKTMVIGLDNNNQLDTTYNDKRLIRSFYYNTDKKNKMIVYCTDLVNCILDTVYFKNGEATEVIDVPFCLNPYKDYYEERGLSLSEISKNIKATFLGEIIINCDNRIYHTYKIAFSHNYWRYPGQSLDHFFFDVHSLLPVRIEYNSIDDYWLYNESEEKIYRSNIIELRDSKSNSIRMDKSVAN